MAKKAAKATQDTRLAMAAIEKERRGEKPTRDESAARRRVEKAREERDRETYYRAVPKRHFLAMAGRQANIVNGIARTWGMPLLGRHVNLYEFFPWFFGWLADNKHALRAIREGKLPDDPAVQADVAYKTERMLLLRTRRQQQDGSLMSRADVREGSAAISSIYRRAGERLRREFGDDAYKIVEECWDDAQRKIDQLFGGSGGEEKT